MFSRWCIAPSYHAGARRPPARRALRPSPSVYNVGTLTLLEVARMTRFIVALLGSLVLVAGPTLAQDKPAAKTPTALVTLEKGGEIVLEFWPQDAPKHVENFVKLVNQKFYDGQRVHRVEPNFVVQFGDPQSKTLPLDDPKMGTGGPGYTIKAEFNKRPFERGVLGMARSNDPDSAGSQIYIMLGPAPFLNGKYTAFGKVVTGMGVVDQIKVGDRIKSIKIVNP
jgi:peptidyl-prolyl cis-trans isomerase B (cyclophilin B)